MLLSIIIPVYKVEEYIEKCLQSIVEGYTLRDKEVEVIIVDDGSPDKSGAIADRFASEYSFCNVIHKKNAGVAAARNTGLLEASGDWIYFVDSDDWLADGAVNQICQRVEENKDADILMFDAYQNMLGKEKAWEHFAQDAIWDSKAEIVLLQQGMLYYPLVDKQMQTPLAAPWDKVYKHSFLEKNGIFFKRN